MLPGHILIVILGTFLLTMSFQLFIENLIHSNGGTIRMPSIPVSAFARTLTGWVSSMMVIAGGALMVPFMTSYGTPVCDAIGTALAFDIPTAFAGNFIYRWWSRPSRNA
ncbi:sulfite exporter TauE/SafE family protein [Litorivicinus sp.]|nr:sulfite exporter TauE/SafE family protein [Litorivicinus sp.]